MELDKYQKEINELFEDKEALSRVVNLINNYEQHKKKVDYSKEAKIFHELMRSELRNYCPYMLEELKKELNLRLNNQTHSPFSGE